MITRPIHYCQLCGKARLTLMPGLCYRCARACRAYPDDAPLTQAGLDRLLDDLRAMPPETNEK